MLADWFKKKEASRKYVDLIKQTSSKWANWDPPLRINISCDFGGINYYSGQFEREGNIYTHPSTASIAAPYPPRNLPTEKEYVAGSINSRKGKFDASAHADVHGIANAAFATQWHFDKTRGALLVMHKPRMSVVPDEFCDITIANEFLKGKMLVTQVFTSHAYALYLSNKNPVKIALKADAAGNPAGSAGADVDTMWWTDGDSGLFRKGFSHEESFTPLYLIKMIKPPPARRRDKVDPNAPKGDRWAQIDVPWGHLEDDGDEQTKGELTVKSAGFRVKLICVQFFTPVADVSLLATPITKIQRPKFWFTFNLEECGLFMLFPRTPIFREAMHASESELVVKSIRRRLETFVRVHLAIEVLIINGVLLIADAPVWHSEREEDGYD